MPRDYIQSSLGLQEFAVLGWKEDKSEVVVEVMKTLSYGLCPQCNGCAKHRTLKDVVLEYQVKYTTFWRLWFCYAQRVLDKRSAKYPRQMGIDEFSVAKRHKYRMVLVDLEKDCVVTSLNGRDSVGLKDYLQTIDEKQGPELQKQWVEIEKEICDKCRM
mgnify:FL=1